MQYASDARFKRHFSSTNTPSRILKPIFVDENSRRSPYRLYRPYQIECPEVAFPTNPTLLYRNANLDVLVEVNKRARSLERAVSYQKVLATIQISLSFLLLILEFTKILLIWEYLPYWDHKFHLLWEVAQPIFFITLGFLLLFCILRPSKGSSQVALVSLIAAIAPMLIFATESPFVTNATGALLIGRLVNRSLLKDLPLADLQYESGNKALKVLQSHAIISYLSLFFKQGDAVTLSMEHLLGLQYLLIAYAFFSFIYSVLLILSLVSYSKLIQLQ